MNPNPLSRTSRLIVPLDIRVSLTGRCPESEYQVPFHRIPDDFAAQIRLSAPAHVARRVGIGDDFQSPRSQSRNLNSYFTVTVIIWHVPAMVLCRSSPSWSASLWRPGVSCMSISDLPSPKCTHDGVPLTMV